MPAPATFTAERFAVEIPPGSIDREKGVVRGVRVVNRDSRNAGVTAAGQAYKTRHYPEAVLSAALAKYEGAPVNVGHHLGEHPLLPGRVVPRPVPPADRFGRLVNARMDAAGITADLKFNPRHPFAEPFLWACEHDPGLYALSQLTNCRWLAPDRDGRMVAESVAEVVSVDIVTEGGTTATVFESFTPEAKMATTPDPKEVAGMLETPGQMIDWLSGFFSALKGIDQPTKDQLLQTAVQALTAGVQAPADGTAADPAAAAAPAMECLRRLGPVGRWAAGRLDGYFTAEALQRKRAWADDLIKAEQLPDNLRTDLFVELVAESHGNPDRAKALIAERKQLAAPPGKKPVTSTAGGGTPKTVGELVEDMAIG